MAQPQPLAVRAKPGVAPGRSPLGRGGLGRRDEAETSLEVGAQPGPHLPLVAACIPLSHVAPGAAGRPPPAQVRSAGAGRCGSELSAGCSETRPGTATPPRRAARLCFRVAGQVGPGAVTLGLPRASLSPPLPPGSSSGRSPLGICSWTRRGWGLLLAHGDVGAIEPRRRLGIRVHRCVPGSDSPQETHSLIAQSLVFAF